ncbi:hypothetical protein BZL43_09895 [Pseudomonas sp. PICF141]|nr:hypothetical protein BZL43_09895 [Pseudomonas sp. PICF141]
MEADPWRGGLSERRIAPFECAALTRSLVHQRFWGCCAAQRGQAPSPQVRSHNWFCGVCRFLA